MTLTTILVLIIMEIPCKAVIVETKLLTTGRYYGNPVVIVAVITYTAVSTSRKATVPMNRDGVPLSKTPRCQNQVTAVIKYNEKQPNLC